MNGQVQTYGTTSGWTPNSTVPTSRGEKPLSGWDFVFIFRAPKCVTTRTTRRQKRIDEAREQMLTDLGDADFSYTQLWHPTSGRMYVRIGLCTQTIMDKAQAMRISLRVRASLGGGYLAFSMGRAELFENEGRRLQHLPYFTPAERLYITRIAIRSREPWGAAINMNELRKSRIITRCFALHSREERDALLEAAVKNQWWNPIHSLPLFALQEYLGPRVALYLAWILFYTRMLCGLALLSIPVFAIIEWSSSLELRMCTQLAFGIVVAFWSEYWQRYWQRRNEIINVRWGLIHSDDVEVNTIRDDFRGVEREGFYSQGGFVHLNDLAVTNSQQNSQVRRHRQQLDSTSDYYEDDIESEESFEEDITMRSQSQRITLATLVRKGRPVWQQVVVVGESDDDDFTLTSTRAELTFPDLPIVPYCNHKVVRLRLWITGLITFVFALLVAALSFALLFFRTEVNIYFGFDKDSGSLSGILTAVLIEASDNAWKFVSKRLSRWENHHTNEGYENSQIRKRFAFQFVSNYVSLLYIAFVKPFTPNDACIPNDMTNKPDCMLELQSQLAGIVIGKATMEQVIELVKPNLVSLAKRLLHIPGQLFGRLFIRRRSLSQHDGTTHEDERRNMLPTLIDTTEDLLHRRPQHDTYTDTDDILATLDEAERLDFKDTIDDYGEIVIQHGFLVLFGISFPPAALINLLNNVIEIRTDTYKVLRIFQRPESDSATDIGGWIPIIQSLSSLSVVTTVGIVTITSPTLQLILSNLLPISAGHAAFEYPFLCFLIAEHVLLFVRWLVTHFVTKQPSSTFRMRARQNFLLARCFGVGMKPFYRTSRLFNQSYYHGTDEDIDADADHDDV